MRRKGFKISTKKKEKRRMCPLSIDINKVIVLYQHRQLGHIVYVPAKNVREENGQTIYRVFNPLDKTETDMDTVEFTKLYTYDTTVFA